MQRTIFVMLLATMSNGDTCARSERDGNRMPAEWVVAGDSEKYTAYADPRAILKAGDLTRVWELLDLKQTYQLGNGEPHRSIKRQSEYDCKQGRWRTIFLSFYSGRMATGQVVYSSAEPDNWQSVPIGSVGDALRRLACDKR